MDGLPFPSDPCCPPSQAWASSTAGHEYDDLQVLEVVPSEVFQQWLGDADAVWGDGGSSSAANGDLSLSAGNSPAPVATRRRGRKPGPRTERPAITHLEAERQRRDKLNRRFCELRAAVPTVSRMDKASLLGDAARYIAELRGRVEQLEAKARQAVALTRQPRPFASGLLLLEEKLEVRMAGPEAAALRLTTAARHGPARLMDALRSLDLPVQHACVCRVGGVTVQDAVVDVPAAALREEGGLRAALLHRLQVITG